MYYETQLCVHYIITRHMYSALRTCTRAYIKCTVIFLHCRKLFNRLLFRKSASLDAETLTKRYLRVVGSEK